jgi:hypothetical protein
VTTCQLFSLKKTTKTNYSLGFSVHVSYDFLLNFSVRFEGIAVFLAENRATCRKKMIDLF